MQYDWGYDPTIPTIDKWLENTIPVRLKKFNGSIIKTAISLGIGRSTLYRIISKHRIKNKSKTNMESL